MTHIIICSIWVNEFGNLLWPQIAMIEKWINHLVGNYWPQMKLCSFKSSDNLISHDRIMHNWIMNQLQALIIMTSNVEIGNWVNRKRLSLWLQMKKASNEVKLLSKERGHHGLSFFSWNISESPTPPDYFLTTFHVHDFPRYS